VTLGWLLPMLSAGLLGSLHCVGMCGGLVAVATDGASGARERGSMQLAYQGARLVSYLTLGIAAGALGHALDLAGKAAGVGKVAAIVAGGTMTVWGLTAMLSAAGVRMKRRLPRMNVMPDSVLVALGRARKATPLVRAGLLGGASALLPCGFLYAFAIAGAATGSPLGGALVLASLWLGNLPALLGWGWLLSAGLGRVKRHVPLISAASVFALGVLTLTSRVNLPALAAQSVEAATPAGARAPMPADCPYHRARKP
jgi:uncharacterized protein